MHIRVCVRSVGELLALKEKQALEWYRALKRRDADARANAERSNQGQSNTPTFHREAVLRRVRVRALTLALTLLL